MSASLIRDRSPSSFPIQLRSAFIFRTSRLPSPFVEHARPTLSPLSREDSLLNLNPKIPIASPNPPTKRLNHTTSPSHRNTNPIPPIHSIHLTRRPRKTRQNIQCRIPRKEIPRPEQQRHRLGGHDGVILWGWEVRDAEGVPEDDVGVVY